MDENQNVMKTGTTTVGILCKDGVVLAADKRATVGYFIANKKTDKIELITDEMAVTMAGTASDSQLLIRVAQSELKLREVRIGRKSNVKEAANLFARMVYGNIRKMSMIPGISHFIIGGIDKEGFQLYEIFADGTISRIDDFISSGSGSVIAYGVLETLYKKDLSVEEGTKLAMKCINAAVQRDVASGDGIDIVTITKDGAKKVLTRMLDKKLEM